MYSPEIIAETKSRILLEVSEGASLESIVKKHKGKDIPKKGTVYSWMQKGHKSFDQEFLDNYARAYNLRQSQMFEDTIDIADNAGLSKEEIAKAKLRIETRQWNLARMNSKRFGNKVETEHTLDKEIVNRLVLGNGINPEETDK